ncbi:hypothetical protein NIES4075_39640 [Tolypothrix sp. NIES-4075]|nr:hypothetical protein NIES4075_39640 [Tolypothrix sp. NIES-4075]
MRTPMGTKGLKIFTPSLPECKPWRSKKQLPFVPDELALYWAVCSDV